ncbi:hypothetical protein TNCV_586251 [Trichonephila clavipes]|nr:hypothetical protein TNCV_586251 [Trichonephila clavipes]
MDPNMLCPGIGRVLATLNIDKVSEHARFLILSLPSNEMSQKSPFSIQKAMQGISGEPKSVKKLRSESQPPIPKIPISSYVPSITIPSPSAILPTIQSETLLPILIHTSITTSSSGNSLNTSAPSLKTDTRLFPTASNKSASLSTEIQPSVSLSESSSTVHPICSTGDKSGDRAFQGRIVVWQVQSHRVRYHSKKRRRWVVVIGSKRNGRRAIPDVLQSGALRWFGKTKGLLVKGLPVSEQSRMGQLATHACRMIRWSSRLLVCRRHPKPGFRVNDVSSVH